MNILKHGKVIVFSCDACGCMWAANRLDIESTNNPETSVNNAMKIRLYMHCPDCGMNCMQERDRDGWQSDKVE